jgi:hypothetical protein
LAAWGWRAAGFPREHVVKPVRRSADDERMIVRRIRHRLKIAVIFALGLGALVATFVGLATTQARKVAVYERVVAGAFQQAATCAGATCEPAEASRRAQALADDLVNDLPPSESLEPVRDAYVAQARAEAWYWHARATGADPSTVAAALAEMVAAGKRSGDAVERAGGPLLWAFD